MNSTQNKIWRIVNTLSANGLVPHSITNIRYHQHSVHIFGSCNSRSICHPTPKDAQSDCHCVVICGGFIKFWHVWGLLIHIVMVSTGNCCLLCGHSKKRQCQLNTSCSSTWYCCKTFNTLNSYQHPMPSMALCFAFHYQEIRLKKNYFHLQSR